MNALSAEFTQASQTGSIASLQPAKQAHHHHHGGGAEAYKANASTDATSTEAVLQKVLNEVKQA